MRKSQIWIFVLLILILVILIGAVGFGVYKELNEDGNGKTTGDKNTSNGEEVVVLETSSSEVQYIVGLIDIFHPDLDDTKILDLLYGDKDQVLLKDFNDEQKLYYAVKAYMEDKHKDEEIAYCLDEEKDNYLEVAKDELKGYFVEDISYLNNIKEDEMITLGDDSVIVSGDSLKVCQNIYGFVGPDVVSADYIPVAAYKKGNKIYVDIKFLYFQIDEDYKPNFNVPEDDMYFHYNVYDSYKASKVIDTYGYLISSYEEFNPDLSKYTTYEFVFNVSDGKYLFESVTKK